MPTKDSQRATRMATGDLVEYRTLTNFRAVIFDLDGTVLDTLEDLADSMNNVLARMGLPGQDLEAYKFFVGDGVEMLVRRALPATHQDDATAARAVRAMREEYLRRWSLKTKPYEGVPELLDGLRARGLKMAILSNKPDDFAKMTVERLLPHGRFDLVLGERPGIARKPDPAGAFEVAERLGLPASAFIYLGDTGTDMQTAVAARMFPVGALWGFRPAAELMANGAKALIRRPLELLDLI